jgi:hypothetical protein
MLEFDSPSRILKVSYDLYTVDLSQTETPVERLKSGTLERTRFRDYSFEEMKITFAPTRALHYALVFPEDADAATLTIKEAKGGDYRIVFPYHQGDAIDILAWQPDTKSSAGYYPDQVRKLMRNVTAPVTGTLGILQPNPAYATPSDVAFDMTLILTIAVVLAVIVLAFAIVKAIRRSEGGN